MKYHIKKNMITKKNANMFFSSFMIVLLIASLSIIAIVASSRLKNIDIKVGLLNNNIQILNSRINSEKYFINELGESLDGDARYGIYASFADDINDIDKYELNRLLDKTIKNGKIEDDNKLLQKINYNKDAVCTYSGKRIIKKDLGCLNDVSINAFSYFDYEFERYITYYNTARDFSSKTNTNEINYSNSFNFAFEYTDNDLIIYGFLDNIEKSIIYSSNAEYTNLKNDIDIEKNNDLFIQTSKIK